MSVRVDLRVAINGRLMDGSIAYAELDHPETANRDTAALLRAVADHLEEDGEFLRIAVESLLDDD